MKYKIKKLLRVSFILPLMFVSCTKDEDPKLIEEQELITTLVLTLSDGATSQTVRWNQDSNNTPSIALQANKSYEVAVSFLDESDPGAVEDLTEEIKEEADEHQVFFEFSGASIRFSSRQGDTTDSANNPLYINSTWTTTSSGTGTVRVYLIHQPTTKTSTNRGGFGGETDAAVDFTVVVSE